MKKLFWDIVISLLILGLVYWAVGCTSAKRAAQTNNGCGTEHYNHPFRS